MISWNKKKNKILSLKSSEAGRKALDLVDDASEENATGSVHQSKTDVKILAQVIDEQG